MHAKRKLNDVEKILRGWHVADDPCNSKILVCAHGEPGNGGAHTRYTICLPGGEVTDLIFQQGDPNVEINGITGEALLAVLIDRYDAFANGPFADHNTTMALVHLRSAMQYLFDRTESRISRNVIGKQLP